MSNEPKEVKENSNPSPPKGYYPGKEIETVEEWLYAFDSGYPVNSVTMGGIGPGYEQSIQLAVVEFVRGSKPFIGAPDDDKTWQEFGLGCELILKDINAGLLGLTGAQFSAAKYLAFSFIVRGGPSKVIEKFPRDRKILFSKQWPRVDRKPTA